MRVTITLLFASFVIALAQDAPQTADFETKIAALKTQLSGKFEDLTKKVQDTVKNLKGKDATTDTQLEELRNKAEAAAGEFKTQIEDNLKDVKTNLQQIVQKAQDYISTQRPAIQAAVDNMKKQAESTQAASSGGLFANLKNSFSKYFNF